MALDAIAPWTVKALATRTREAITQAAQRENLTVGQWLERRVDEWLEQGSPIRQAYPVSDLVSLATVAAALAQAPDQSVVKTARIAVKMALLAGRPPTAKALPPPVAPSKPRLAGPKPRAR